MSQLLPVGADRFPDLFMSAPFSATVEVEGHLVTRDVVSMLKVHDHGHGPCIFFGVYEPHDTLRPILSVGMGGQLLVAHRCATLLGELEVISDHSIVHLARAVMNGTGFPGLETRAAALAQTVPAGLDQMLVLLWDRGMNCITAEIADLAASGRMTLNMGLEELGLETPEQVRTRKAREEAALRPFKPVLKLLSESGESAETCDAYVLACLKRGIYDHVLIGGFILYLMELARHSMAGSSVLAFGGTLLVTDFGGGGIDGRHMLITETLPTIGNRAMSLASGSDERTGTDVVNQILSLYRRYSCLPVTNI